MTLADQYGCSSKMPDISPMNTAEFADWRAEGSHADIYKVAVRGRTYIIKVGKTNWYAPPFLKAFRISFSRRKASEFLARHLGPTFRIVPDEALIRAGLRDYRILATYFSDSTDARNGRAHLLRALGISNDPFTRHLAEILSVPGVRLVREAVAAHLDENFLPREQTVIGHPLQTEWVGPEERACTSGSTLTYFIIQEAILGSSILPLRNVSDSQLVGRGALIGALVTFVVLAKKMYWDTGLLLDTRPDEVVKHPFEWFRQTSNILVDLDLHRLYFVDTRWFWRADTFLGNQGINLVELLGIRSLNRAIKRYVRLISSSM